MDGFLVVQLVMILNVAHSTLPLASRRFVDDRRVWSYALLLQKERCHPWKSGPVILEGLALSPILTMGRVAVVSPGEEKAFCTCSVSSYSVHMLQS